MYGSPLIQRFSALLRRRTLDRKGWYAVLLAEPRDAERRETRSVRRPLGVG
jgi:hypothetical protein